MFNNLSISLTKSIPDDIKKSNGIFFTPKNIVVDIIDKIKNYNFKTILEPSCGSCQFIDYIDITFNDKIIDCNEYNLEIYEKIKLSQYKNKVEFYNNDFLNNSNISKKKYDLIIGNPPYYVLKNYSDKKWKHLYTGRINIYILFIIHSLEILNTDGILAFVLPENFLTCHYYNKLRTLIFKNYKILDITINNDSKYLETAQKTISLIIQNSINFNNDIYTLYFKEYIVFNTFPNIIKLKELLQNSTTLYDIGYSVNIGQIVWNQNKNNLTNNESDIRIIYSGDIINNKLNLTKYKNIEKKNFIKPGNYKIFDYPVIVVNRGYGTGQYKWNYTLINMNNYVIENHLLVISKLNSNYNDILNSFNNKKTQEFINLYFCNNAINIMELLYILPIYL